MPEPIPLADRERAYQQAETHAEQAATEYLTARAGGQRTQPVIEQMDHAQAELRRAKRRLEEAVRREAKRAAKGASGPLNKGDRSPATHGHPAVKRTFF